MDRLAREDGVLVVDAGVDDADGHSGARLSVGPLQQVHVAVGEVGVDGVETPLRLEVPVRRVVRGQLGRHRVELRRGHALPAVDGHAGVLRRFRQGLRRLGRFGRGRRLGGRRRWGRRGPRGARRARPGGAPGERDQDSETGKEQPGTHRAAPYRNTSCLTRHKMTRTAWNADLRSARGPQARRRCRALPPRPRLQQRFQPGDPLPQDAHLGPQVIPQSPSRLRPVPNRAGRPMSMSAVSGAALGAATVSRGASAPGPDRVCCG